jgi:hypothetical protein
MPHEGRAALGTEQQDSLWRLSPSQAVESQLRVTAAHGDDCYG